MSVHFGSHGRRRAAVAVVAVAVAVALLLAYTIISTRKATDDVIANVSEVYLGELSKQLVFHFDTGVESKFSQLETVASGLEMAAPESREQTVDYLQAQAGNDDYAFLAVRTASGEFVSADGEVRPCDGDGGELPAYYDAQGRRVVLYDDKIVLVDDIEPLRCGDDTIVAAVCGFSSLGVGDRLNLTLFDGFSRSIMIDRDGMCVVSDRNSGLDSGESLFALIDERGSFVGGSSEEERIRSVLASGGTVNVPIVFDGRSEYLYFYPLGHAEWYLCTVMPYSVIEGDIGDLSGTIAANAAIVGAAVLLFVLLVFLLYYRMARRNTRLLAEEKDRAERAFAEAQQASLAKTEFLSRMSHEIRTPMNGIMGMTAIALESIGDDGKVRTCLEKVTLSSEHLLSLINDILDMSKIESGKVEIKNEPFDLSTFIGSLAAVFRTQASERNVAFDTVVEGEVPGHVVGDPLRLNQVVYNLMGNAFKFTPEGGSVTLRIERLADAEDGCVWLRFAVDDTGCGIEPEHLDKIFASFEQGDASVARKHGGTGLGLAITKRFVELMGGRIRVASVVGHGSSFAVDVPPRPRDGGACRRRRAGGRGGRRARRPPSGRARLRGRAHPRGRGQRPEPGDSRGAHDHGGRERRDGLHGPRGGGGVRGLRRGPFRPRAHGRADARAGRLRCGARHPGHGPPGRLHRGHSGHDGQRLHRRRGAQRGERDGRPLEQAP